MPFDTFVFGSAVALAINCSPSLIPFSRSGYRCYHFESANCFGVVFADTTGGNVGLELIRAGEDEATPMRRKCARSIYELSTRPDKGPLLAGNGVLKALAALSAVRASFGLHCWDRGLHLSAAL